MLCKVLEIPGQLATVKQTETLSVLVQSTHVNRMARHCIDVIFNPEDEGSLTRHRFTSRAQYNPISHKGLWEYCGTKLCPYKKRIGKSKKSR